MANEITVVVESTRIIEVIEEGPQGPSGPAAAWLQVTQAEYDAIPTPDPTVLYVIIN